MSRAPLYLNGAICSKHKEMEPWSFVTERDNYSMHAMATKILTSELFSG